MQESSDHIIQEIDQKEESKRNKDDKPLGDGRGNQPLDGKLINPTPHSRTTVG